VYTDMSWGKGATITIDKFLWGFLNRKKETSKYYPSKFSPD